MIVRLCLCVFIIGIGLNASERLIGVLVRQGYKGENSFAYRIKIASRNIGWKADVIDIQNSAELIKKEYDFVISLVPGLYSHPKCKNYLAIFHPLHHYFNNKGLLYNQYCFFDGYLLSYSPKAIENIEQNFLDAEKFPYMRWYPSVHKVKYQVNNPINLFHTCCSWGDRMKDSKFNECLFLLDKKFYTHLYGDPFFKKYYPNTYQGEIPYNDNSLLERSAKAGISLVLHSSDHNAYGIPSGRIFEAAASSTVIICDQNAFVYKHFGDTVLYINSEEGPSLYKQIEQHLQWIRSNKEQALDMAKRAYLIYKEKFLLEDQLLELEKFHEQLTIEI